MPVFSQISPDWLQMAKIWFQFILDLQSGLIQNLAAKFKLLIKTRFKQVKGHTEVRSERIALNIDQIDETYGV